MRTLCLFVAACSGLSSQPWAARHGLTPAQYQSTFDDLAGKGYRLINVSGYTSGGNARYAALWEKKAGPPLAARHGLTPAQYQSTFDDMAKQGYRLTWVHGHVFNGGARYAAIWEKRAGPPLAARHGLTGAEYQKAFDDLGKQGFRLIHVAGHSQGGSARYAAIWEKSGGPQMVARHGLTSSEYQQAFNQFTQQGYRLKMVSGYQIGTSDHYAAIWEKTGSTPWLARHGMPAVRYQHIFDNYYYQGYKPAFVQAFRSGNGGRINAIWENTNLSGSDLGVISSKAKSYLDTNQVPGVAFAITRNGRLVYAAGFGQADANANEEASPTHRFRVASVSKPITSVAVMKLVEAGKVSLSDKVFGPGSILGSKYATPAGNKKIEKITVRHLLQHVSGLSNTPNDPMFQNTALNHNALITWVLNDPARAVTREPGSRYEYSNFGYCLLGRVIEQKTGKNYEQAVRDLVLNPSGGTNMTIGANSLAQRKADEVVYTPAGAYNLNVARFDSHGGWIATPIDLVRVLVRVDGQPSKPDILSAGSFMTMTTKAGIKDKDNNDPNYALGWVVSPPWHNGAMSGTTAIMAVYQNGFTYAALANTRPAGDQFAGKLSQMVKDVIAGVSAWPGYDLF